MAEGRVGNGIDMMNDKDGQTSVIVAPYGVTYDYSGWPIVVIYMPPQLLSASAFEQHLTACGEPYRRLKPFGGIMVMGEHPPLPAAQRRASALAMKANIERYPGLCRGLAIVVRSALGRGIVTAHSWLARPPHPFAAFETVPAAKEWLLGHLRHVEKSPRTRGM
jgi:hypothetical protein